MSGTFWVGGYACLLDTMNIEHVMVIAVSAGGPSALQFALSYPDRVDALVLVSAISTLRPIRDDAGGPSSTLLTDLVFWLAATYLPDGVLAAVGVLAAALEHISTQEHERMWSTMRSFQPMSRRMPGMNLDTLEQNLPAVEELKLEDITTPTLVIHALDDGLIPFAQGQYSADHIYPECPFSVLRSWRSFGVRAGFSGGRNGVVPHILWQHMTNTTVYSTLPQVNFASIDTARIKRSGNEDEDKVPAISNVSSEAGDFRVL